MRSMNMSKVGRNQVTVVRGDGGRSNVESDSVRWRTQPTQVTAASWEKR